MPIKSSADFERYIASDLAAHKPPLSRWRPWYGILYPIAAWQRRLRWAEYVLNCFQGPAWVWLRVIAKYRLRQASIRLGFTIPVNTFGPGLSVAHWGTITINDGAQVGHSCRIHQGVTIGSKNGQSPIIGDDCFIGAGAAVIGGVVLGNKVSVGANAVVTRSFSDGAVLVGIPARDIRKRDTVGSD